MINDLLRNTIYYLESFRARPLWAIVPAVVALAAGVAVIFSLPRGYDSEALLMIETYQSSSSLVPTTVASEQLQFVEQRVLAREKLLELASQFDLFPDQRQVMSDTMLAQLVRQHIRIHTVASEPSERYAGTSAMRIGFRSETAAQSSAVTAQLVKMIIDENLRLRIQRATDMSQFLDREAQDLTGRLAVREREWRAYLEANVEAMPERIQSLGNELQDRERELSEHSQAISALDQEMRLLEAELRLGRQRPATAALDRAHLAELEAELATKSVTYSSEHPEIRALMQRIDSQKQRIARESAQSGPIASQELSPELALVSERIAIGKQRQEELEGRRLQTMERIAALRSTIAKAPSVQARLEAIERERESMQRAVDEMNGKLATARISERLERDGSTAHVQVIEHPETPRYPTSPSRTRLLALALAGSFAVGLVGLYVGDNMQRTIRGTFDLQNALAGSTLVVIPYWSPETGKRSIIDVALDRIAGTRPRDESVAT